MSFIYGGWRGRVQRGVMAVVTFGMVLALSATASAAVPARTVLVLGDSLSAGYGLPASQGWVSLTATKMRKSHPAWKMVNASISGETTAGGAARIAGELKRNQPSVVVIELGANDGLRGLALSQSRANLDKIIGLSRASGAKVLLVGMRMPPNFGSAYVRGFETMYTDLARKHQVALLPFLLAPIASDRSNFQADNLHPVAAAQPKLRDHVWPALAPLLR